MSTRGYLGIKKKGELKGHYNHFDSYITNGLGEQTIKYINSLDKSNLIDILNDTFDYIELVDERSTPTKEQIDICKESGYLDLNVSTQSVDDWYCLLRNTQGCLNLYVDKKCKYMINGNEFLKDNISCEYGYVINLDDNTFDIYKLGYLKGKYNLLELDLDKIKSEVGN